MRFSFHEFVHFRRSAQATSYTRSCFARERGQALSQHAERPPGTAGFVKAILLYGECTQSDIGTGDCPKTRRFEGTSQYPAVHCAAILDFSYISQLSSSNAQKALT